MKHYLSDSMKHREERKRRKEAGVPERPAPFSTDTWDDDEDDANDGRTFAWWSSRGSVQG